VLVALLAGEVDERDIERQVAQQRAICRIGDGVVGRGVDPRERDGGAGEADLRGAASGAVEAGAVPFDGAGALELVEDSDRAFARGAQVLGDEVVEGDLGALLVGVASGAIMSAGSPRLLMPEEWLVVAGAGGVVAQPVAVAAASQRSDLGVPP
jgi:hypothetical protein